MSPFWPCMFGGILGGMIIGAACAVLNLEECREYFSELCRTAILKRRALTQWPITANEMELRHKAEIERIQMNHAERIRALVLEVGKLRVRSHDRPVPRVVELGSARGAVRDGFCSLIHRREAE